jgi:hypothetical protein
VEMPPLPRPASIEPAVPDMRPRYFANHRKDASEGEIADALERAGFLVWDKLPVDLLTWRADLGFQLLECKTPTKTGKRRKRKDQADQAEFLTLTKTPVALTPEAALLLLGALRTT